MSDNENLLVDFLGGLPEERRFALKDFFLDKHFDDPRAVELLQELYGNTYQALSSSQSCPTIPRRCCLTNLVIPLSRFSRRWRIWSSPPGALSLFQQQPHRDRPHDDCDCEIECAPSRAPCEQWA